MIPSIAEQKSCSAIEEIIWKPLYSDRRHTRCVGRLFFRVTYAGSLLRDGPLEKLWGAGGGGRWEIFEPQEIFWLSNSLYEFF